MWWRSTHDYRCAGDSIDTAFYEQFPCAGHYVCVFLVCGAPRSTWIGKMSEINETDTKTYVRRNSRQMYAKKPYFTVGRTDRNRVWCALPLVAGVCVLLTGRRPHEQMQNDFIVVICTDQYKNEEFGIPANASELVCARAISSCSASKCERKAIWHNATMSNSESLWHGAKSNVSFSLSLSQATRRRTKSECATYTE